MEPITIHTALPTSPAAQPAANPELNLDEVKELALNAFEDAKAQWEVVSQHANAYIRENPGKAVLAAVGAGVLIGLLIKD